MYLDPVNRYAYGGSEWGGSKRVKAQKHWRNMFSECIDDLTESKSVDLQRE